MTNMTTPPKKIVLLGDTSVGKTSIVTRWSTGAYKPDQKPTVGSAYTEISREDAVIVGDRLYTDIATGANAGVDTICVLSGEASMKDIQEWDGEPTWIFQDVKEIFQKLQTEPSA